MEDKWVRNQTFLNQIPSLGWLVGNIVNFLLFLFSREEDAPWFVIWGCIEVCVKTDCFFSNNVFCPAVYLVQLSRKCTSSLSHCSTLSIIGVFTDHYYTWRHSCNVTPYSKQDTSTSTQCLPRLTASPRSIQSNPYQTCSSSPAVRFQPPYRVREKKTSSSKLNPSRWYLPYWSISRGTNNSLFGFVMTVEKHGFSWQFSMLQPHLVALIFLFPLHVTYPEMCLRRIATKRQSCFNLKVPKSSSFAP